MSINLKVPLLLSLSELNFDVFDLTKATLPGTSMETYKKQLCMEVKLKRWIWSGGFGLVQSGTVCG